MNQQLLAIALQEAPAVITWLADAFRKKNPDAPQPTEAEVIAAWNLAFISSLAKDDAWLAAHPKAAAGPTA